MYIDTYTHLCCVYGYITLKLISFCTNNLQSSPQHINKVHFVACSFQINDHCILLNRKATTTSK